LFFLSDSVFRQSKLKSVYQGAGNTMKTFAVLAILMLFGACSAQIKPNATTDAAKKAASIYDFTVRDIDGKEVKLDAYKGKTALIVNTASKCGYTPQYEGLQKIYDKYKAQNFVVLGFPANNFMGQEPGTNEEIKNFCTTKYKVTFPMFAKISVKGEDIAPLYDFLTSKDKNPQFAGDISWNFNKFLVDKNGKVIARFSSKDAPESEAVTKAIEAALK
jgi:glutathione peroxidase